MIPAITIKKPHQTLVQTRLPKHLRSRERTNPSHQRMRILAAPLYQSSHTITP